MRPLSRYLELRNTRDNFDTYLSFKRFLERGFCSKCLLQTGFNRVLILHFSFPANIRQPFVPYTFHDTDVTWMQAETACLNMNAHLVTMETNKEWETVKKLIKEKVGDSLAKQHWFIGLRKLNDAWTWIEPDGVTRGTVAVTDSRWQTDEPSNDFNEPCAEIQSYYRKQRGHFNNVLCTKKPSDSQHRGYICEHTEMP